MQQHFKNFNEFAKFLNKSSQDGTLCLQNYTQIYDALEDCMEHSEAIEYGHGELTDIVYETNNDGWEFKVIYTYPDSKTFEIKKEEIW